MRCLVVVQEEGRAVLCLLTNTTQDMNQKYYISHVEPRNRRNWSIHIPSSRVHLLAHFLLCYTHRQHRELSWHHVTCTKQRFSFQNTPDNLHNFVLPLWASFRYMTLHHNANASDVDWFLTHSDGTYGQPQRKREAQGNDANISDKSTAVVRLGPFEHIHLGTHPWTHTYLQLLRRQGWEGMGRLLWYNLSWSGHDSPLFTIPADGAALLEREFAFSGVVGRLPVIYGANVWQNLRPNEQWEVAQPQCLWGSSRSLQSADDQLVEG